MPSAPLVFNNFTKRYGHDIGVRDMSFELRKGEVFGFLGPNGAGKTTTIRAILNFLHPSEGSITVFGKDSVTESVSIKQQVGYLAGDIALYPHMSGIQLLRYMTALGQSTDWEYVTQLSETLEAQLEKPIHKLSKGNKQKIGLIQALMHKPDLILLDEPTSGLDPLMQQAFYDIVDAVRTQGGTLFISSHNLQEVQRLCDRAAFIRRGELVAIEDVGQRQDLNLRRYRVRFKKPPQQKQIQSIAGVSEVRLDHNSLTATVSGSPGAFLKAMSEYEVLDFGEEETNLEDVFMHYYQEESHV